MKNNKIFGLILGLGLISLCSAIAITSCEVGLGAAVDIAAPDLSFDKNTVDSGAVIRDAFMVHGSWTDDGNIKDVSATLKQTGGSNTSFKVAGEVITAESGKGTWNVVFDPIKDNIPDGSYEISIDMTDQGKHTSTITRAIVIDNTAPLVVLSRPSTKIDSGKFDSYGQSFTLEGKAADDNDVSLIEVNVYADETCTGEPLKTVKLPNVPLTIEQDVAVYDKTKANDYSVIYGHVDAEGIAIKDGTTAKRYCTLVVYDGAQRYPKDGSAQTEADKKGNSVNYYYLNSDVSKLFTAGYKITELYHILNGSFEVGNSSRSITVDDVTTLLADPAKRTVIGKFSINPENSPSYVVSSRNTLAAGHALSEYPITNGNSQIEVEIAPGLDGHLIVEDSVGIYLVKCDDYGKPMNASGDVVTKESEAKIVWLIEKDKHDTQAIVTQSGSTYKFKTANYISNENFDLTIGDNYYIAVTGKDEQGNDIVCDGLYGFQLITSGLNIEVGTNVSPTWVSTKNDANNTNKKATVTLTYSTENKPFEIYRGTASDNMVRIDESNVPVESSPYRDYINVSDSNKPTKLFYMIKGSNSAQSNIKEVELKYDNTEPVVAITKIPDTKATQQTTITFKGTASDFNSEGEEESGVKEVYVQIIDGTNTANATPAAGEDGAITASYSGGEWLCEITPSEYADATTGGAFAAEGPKTIKVTAVDGVGLKSEATGSFVFDTGAPEISLTNYKLYGSSTTTTLKNSSSLVVGKTFTVTGKLTEKYGLNTDGLQITQVWTNFDETSTTTKTKKISITTPVTNGNWTITLPFNGSDGSAYDNDTIVGNHSADGTYTYTIKAKDKSGKPDNNGISFSAILKTDGPNLVISSPEFETVSGELVTKNWQKTTDIMISGKASSPATVHEIYYSFFELEEPENLDNPAGNWGPWTQAEGSDNWSFTVSVGSDRPAHKLKIKATDTINNEPTVKEYTLKVDSSGPEIVPKFYRIASGTVQQASGTIFVSGTQKLTVFGTWDENISGPYISENGDTLKPLSFTINGKAKTATIVYSNTSINDKTTSNVASVFSSNTTTVPGADTKSWRAEFDKSVLTEAGGFVITARNGAGVAKNNSDLSVSKDSTAPVIGDTITITNSSFKETKTEGNVAVDYYYVNNKTTPTISGTASDSNLLSVAVKAEYTGQTTISKSSSNNPFNWSFDLKSGTNNVNDMKNWTHPDDETNYPTVTITVTDKAGNTKVKKLKFIFDTKSPLAIHEWDKQDKDKVFRIGEANNDLDELSAWNSSINELDEVLDKNVGGKYKNGTFGNSETIKIRGNFEDEGSGVATIYYKAFTSTPTKAQIEAFVANPETQKTGNAILPKEVTQRVSYTDTDGSRKFESVKTLYSTLVPDLVANNTNYIVVLAVDKVGNVGLDYAEKTNFDSTKEYSAKNVKDSYYTLNIDTIATENVLDTDINGYVNPAKTSEITISGVANSGKNDDGTEPVKAANVFIELKINGKRILTEDDDDYNAYEANGKIVLNTTDSPYSKTNAHWTATIKTQKVFENLSTGAYPVYAIVSDAAGNKQTFTVATINIDKTNPTVTINTINDADKDKITDTSDPLYNTNPCDVNGTLEITGTASDTEKLASVVVKYKKTSDTNWTTKTQETGSTPSNWKVKFDTTSLTNKTVYDIQVTAKDAAGNTQQATKQIYVNQASDRPIVKFTNLSQDASGAYILKYGNEASLEGTITDDDVTSTAVVKTFIASTAAITSTSGWTESPAGTWKHANNGTTVFNKATGDYTFTPKDKEDGPKTVYFYIEDNSGNKFWTTQTASDNLKNPYQQYKTDVKTDNTGAITYKSDSNAPTINSVELQTYTAASGGTGTTPTSLGASCIVGGENKKYVTLSVSAKDGNGIKGIVIELEQTTDANGTKVVKRYRSNTSVGTGTFTASGSVAATANINSNHVYTTGRLALATLGFTQNSSSTVNDIKEGKVTVKIYVYDNSGLYSNQESLFVIDNTKPTFEITAPKDDQIQDYDAVYAIRPNTVGGSIKGDTDVAVIYYAITTSQTKPTDNATGTSTAGWHEIPEAKLSASVIFDGENSGTNQVDGYHSDTMRKWLKTLTGKTDDQLNSNDNLIPMYVHFKAVDNCGNAGYATRRLNVIPNGDKPVIELVYPENKAGGEIPSLAGTIRVYGYASVEIGKVDSAYIQIDPSYDSTEGFNESGWETELAGLEDANYTVVDIGTSGKRGIKANGTGNWNLPINANNEFNPRNPDGTINTDESRHMAIRIYAYSDSMKISEPYEQLFDVDPNAPHIGGDGSKDALTNPEERQYSLQIVEFDNVTPGADIDITTYKNPVGYKPDIWTKGQKYLIASVYDDSGIKALTLNENISGVGKINLVSFTGTGENQIITINPNASLDTRNGGGHITVTESRCGYAAGKKNVNIIIPLPTNTGSGSVNWQLEATEAGDNNNSCTEIIKINYDNAAPKLGMTDHSKYSIDPDVHQSNGFYTLKGYTTDAEGDSNVSGIRGVAFYFMRRGTAATNPVTKVYDPMLENNSVAVRTGNTNATGITYSHGLYWKTKAITRDSTNFHQLTLTAGTDPNIHEGGLALIGGNIYRIESVSGATVILDDEIPASQTTANFALALVVDNLTKKETTTGRTLNKTAGTYGYGYYSKLSSADDGDLMVEDWDGTSIEGQWTAIINSANIPDGPIELHYVAFDKAQNYAVGIVGNVAKATYDTYKTKDVDENKNLTGTQDTTNNLVSTYYYTYDANKPAYISNNAPRIAGVTVGCDYDGNGEISDSETRTKYYKTEQRLIGGNITDVITDVAKKFIASSNGNSNGDPMMVVKDKINVQLEIIGGNGNLYYQWNIDSAYKEHSVIADPSNTTNPFTQKDTAMSYTKTTNEGLTEDNYYITSELPAIDFSVDQLETAVGGSNKVCWWTIEIWDSTEETTKFTTSQYAELKLPLDVQILDNTAPKTVISDLYWNSATDNSVYKDVNDNLFGHIELKGDLGSSALGTDYGTTDDKVSGIVVFKGFAYDNKRLSSLKWAIVDHVANNTYTSPTYLFPATNSKLQDGATFNDGSWAGSGTLNANHYTFEVSDAAEDGAYLDEKGHKVAWTLTVDTSYIKNVVEKDARLYIYAVDTNSKTTTITNTEETSNSTDPETYDNTRSRPTYQIDIVPYITGVTTRLAQMNTPDPVIYSRTAQGHYPIATNETSVVLKGYNLAQNNADVTLGETDITALTTDAYAYTVRTGITTINNLNNNDAHGSYNINATGLTESKKVANMYNRQPNTTTNLTLTDDVYFDLWELKDGAQGNGGKIKEPVMRINPANNVVGFAFASGAAYFSMPGQTNSFELWQRNYADYNGIAMAYDYSGYAHTLATGLDTAPSNNYAGRMNYTNSAFGHKYTGYTDYNAAGWGNFSRRTQIALESIGGGGILDQERFSDVAIAVGSLAAGFPTVYVAYCDTNTNQIRFRYGTINSTSRYENNAYNNFGQLNDSKSSTGTIQDTDNGDNYTRHGAFEAHTDYYSLIAGGTTGNTAGNYVSLDVIPGKDNNNNHSAANDVVVVVWSDGSKLNYMYRFGTKNDTDASSDGVANYWSKPITITTGKAEYCKVKVDPVGGIHIAWFDRTKSDLKYAYMSSYNSAYTGGAYNGAFDQSKLYVTTVDAYSQIGSYLDIDVGRETADGNVIPYISYFADGMNSLPKFAYLPDGINNTNPVVPNGADASTNLYTGSWEMSLIPTLSDVRSDNINIALWKNRANGVINYTPTVANTITASDPTATGSTVLPNGKSEVIVGYATVRGTTGYIETAQRK